MAPINDRRSDGLVDCCDLRVAPTLELYVIGESISLQQNARILWIACRLATHAWLLWLVNKLFNLTVPSHILINFVLPLCRGIWWLLLVINAMMLGDYNRCPCALNCFCIYCISIEHALPSHGCNVRDVTVFSGLWSLELFFTYHPNHSS